MTRTAYTGGGGGGGGECLPQRTLVLLDGTWRQTRQMLNGAQTRKPGRRPRLWCERGSGERGGEGMGGHRGAPSTRLFRWPSTFTGTSGSKWLLPCLPCRACSQRGGAGALRARSAQRDAAAQRIHALAAQKQVLPRRHSHSATQRDRAGGKQIPNWSCAAVPVPRTTLFTYR